MNNRQNEGFLSGRTAIILIIVLLLIATIFILWQQQNNRQATKPGTTAQDTTTITHQATPDHLELPALNPGEQIIVHTGFTLSYNNKYEEANWVAYKLTGPQASSSLYDRKNQFAKDPNVASGTASDEDYQSSGYDRGHLAPAEDMAWSEKSMEASFYYSNMAPQVPAFNRGVWRRLEELTRFWASYYDSIFVVTGPVLKGNLSTIGKVSVPQYFYKVILEQKQGEVKAIGFVLPNKASAATLKSFAVSVDSIENLTGIDFFPKLPDHIEQIAEKDPNTREWQWTRKKASKNRKPI